MPITVGGTTITFNDSTTQSTAWTGSAGGVTSAVAGNGVAVSGATGAVTFSQSCPTALSVGSYVSCMGNGIAAIIGNNFSGASLTTSNWIMGDGNAVQVFQYGATMSGTWKWMSGTFNNTNYIHAGIMCRVS